MTYGAGNKPVGKMIDNIIKCDSSDGDDDNDVDDDDNENNNKMLFDWNKRIDDIYRHRSSISCEDL